MRSLTHARQAALGARTCSGAAKHARIVRVRAEERGGAGLSEDVLAQLRKAEEEAAQLRKQLLDLQEEKVGAAHPWGSLGDAWARIMRHAVVNARICRRPPPPRGALGWPPA